MKSVPKGAVFIWLPMVMQLLIIPRVATKISHCKNYGALFCSDDMAAMFTATEIERQHSVVGIKKRAYRP